MNTTSLYPLLRSHGDDVKGPACPCKGFSAVLAKLYTWKMLAYILREALNVRVSA